MNKITTFLFKLDSAVIFNHRRHFENLKAPVRSFLLNLFSVQFSAADGRMALK